MKKRIVVLMIVLLAGMNSLAFAKDALPDENSSTVKPANKIQPVTKPVNTKKPVTKKATTLSKGKGGAKDTTGTKNSPNGILKGVKPSKTNPKAAGDKQNGKGTANNPGL